MQRNNVDIWYKISVVLICLFASLYFQVAWKYPVVDGFPLAERLLDSSFNPNDFFTNTFGDFSPRFYIANFYVIGAKLFGVHYTEFVAVANIVRLFITYVALYFLFMGLTRDRVITLIALYLSSLSFLFVPRMLAWWPIVFDLTGSSMSELFLMIAWALVVYNRLFLAYITIAIALVFHPVGGMYGFIIAALLYFSRANMSDLIERLKMPSTYVGAILILSGLMASYVPYLKALDGFKLDDSRFIEIIVNIRHPHHYLPTTFHWEAWVSFLIYSACFVYMWKKIKTDLYNKKIVLIVVVYSVAMMFLGWLFGEQYQTRLAATIIPYRSFPILIPIYVMVTAYFMFDKYKKKDYLSFSLLHLPFIPYESVGLTWFFFPDMHDLTLPTVVQVAVFSMVILFDKKPSMVAFINSKMAIIFETISFNKLVAIASVGIVVFAISRFSLFIPTLDNSPAVYKWLNENVSESDAIVAELHAADNQKIRLVAKRAVVASKDFPFLEKYYEEWYQRYYDVYKKQKQSRGYIDTRSAEDLNKLLDKYKAGILIRTKELEENPYFVLLTKVQGEKAMALIYKNKSLDR